MTAGDVTARGADGRSERVIGRLLIAMTYVAVALLILGVTLMAAAGISPLAVSASLDATEVVAQIATLTPAGILYLGIIMVIATPITRVVGAAISFASDREWRMVGVAAAILAVIVLGLGIAMTGTV